MIIITVKYMGPTSNKGSRYKAIISHHGGTMSTIVPRSYEANENEQAELAANALLDKWEKETGNDYTDAARVVEYIGEDYQYNSIVRAYYR